MYYVCLRFSLCLKAISAVKNDWVAERICYFFFEHICYPPPTFLVPPFISDQIGIVVR